MLQPSLRTICVIAVLTAILFPWRASATYAPGPTSFCQELPDRASTTSAVFLGIVRQVVMPTRTIPTPPSQPNQSGIGIAKQGRLLAGGQAPETELKYPTARFEVLENFVGAQAGEFELRMSSDHFLDGIPQQVPPFIEGEIWLVEAYRDLRDHQWTTSFGQRNKPFAQAQEDLQVLRTWVSGQTLPARFYGEIFNPAEKRYFPGVRVDLRGEKQIFSSITDSLGHFAFENLPPGIYEAAAVLPQGVAPIKIDLVRTWCSHRVFNSSPDLRTGFHYRSASPSPIPFDAEPPS